MHGTRRETIRRTRQWRVVLVGGAAAVSLSLATGLGLQAVVTADNGSAQTSLTTTGSAQTQSGTASAGQPSTRSLGSSPLVSAGSGNQHATSSGS